MNNFNLVMLLKLAVILISQFTASHVHAAVTDPGSKVKAAIIFKITRFVHWSDVKSTNKVLDLCVMGDAALFSELKTTEGKRSKGFEIKVQQVDESQQKMSECELLFLGENARLSTSNLAKKLANETILSVSDRGGFAKEGGMIQLKERGGRIRFTINLKATRASGLDISSQLLGLAKLIQ